MDKHQSHTPIEPDEEYADPFAGMDPGSPPCAWEAGEYPPIDDLRSWFHLTRIREARFDKERSPEIPEALYAFRIGEFSALVYSRYHFGARRFFGIYGTTDVYTAAGEQWLRVLANAFQALGAEGVRREFPRGAKPPRTRSHTDPRIERMLRALRADDSPAEISVGGRERETPPRPEPVEQERRSVQVSQTYVEPPIIPGHQAALSPSAPAPRPAAADSLRARQLPSTYDSVPMGSGVSSGIIGRGGMAVVYKVRNPVLEVTRAGKVLDLPKVCDTEEQAKRLRNRYDLEAKITAQLLHANIVPVYLYDEFMGLPYLEMEYIDGLDLQKLIDAKGGLPIELVTSIGILSARGVSHAHRQEYTLYGKAYQSIMHRDIKPANILLSRKKGDVKVTDFGLARPAEVSLNTLANNTVGTLPYMSPEQLETRETDSRTDIYSLGATLYEMTTGRRLFPQENMVELLDARRANHYPPMSDFRRDVPKGLTALVDRCLKSRLDERIQSAETLEDFLEDVHKRVTGEKPEAVAADYLVGQRSFAGMTPPKRGAGGGLFGRVFGEMRRGRVGAIRFFGRR